MSSQAIASSKEGWNWANGLCEKGHFQTIPIRQEEIPEVLRDAHDNYYFLISMLTQTYPSMY
jgi:hypothetical protein